MRPELRAALRALATAALLLLPACVAPAPAEQLAAFELLLPEPIPFGLPFDLTVRAVGSAGTIPFGSDGSVALASDRGTLSADAVELSGGVGTVQATLYAEPGAVTLSASSPDAVGEASSTVALLAALPGDPDDPVAGAIPDLDYEPDFATFEGGHPELSGTPSTDTLGIGFRFDATVAEANALLASFGAGIVGGIPGEPGGYAGLLLVRAATGSHTAMAELLDRLRGDPIVERAVQDALLFEERQPLPNDGDPSDWDWGLVPAGGNWGLEEIRVPQMWNLNDAVEKALANGETSRVRTAVYDSGFCPHEDLAYFEVDSNVCGSHGTRVAGIVGATFGAGLDRTGVDGINPFADLVVLARANATQFSFLDALKRIARKLPPIRLVNRSVGGGYDPASAADLRRLDTDTDALIDFLDAIGALAPLIVDSAGNDAIDARFDGAPAFAALERNRPGIVVVEAIDLDGERRSNSNVGGHLAAPGQEILSTDEGSDYAPISDTSAAAPHVTGVAGYLLALDPSLTSAELTQLLLDNARPGLDSAPIVDAFASALDIDRVQGGDRILRMLLDIDDGTPDGNQRTVIAGVGSSVDIDGDGVADAALEGEGPLTFSSVRFEGDDADADGGLGDGRIDMADFRRWRDWHLQLAGAGAASLDGGANHPKRDPNGNGFANEGADEGVYPRGDFNGDGVLSVDPNDTALVPGAIDDFASDLGVLAALFDDPHVGAGQLQSLIASADVTVWPKGCFDLEVDGIAVQEVVSSVRLQGADEGDTLDLRSHGGLGERQIYTVPLPNAYTVRVEAIGGGEPLAAFERDYAGLALGEDVLFDACDPRPTLTSVTGSRSTLTAIEGPDDIFTEVEFTLAFEDAGENVETIVPVFTLGDTTISAPPLGVDDDAVDGFAGEATGGGTVLFDLLVFCSEEGTSPMVATFQLVDAFGQVSEERSFDLQVDYGDC